MIRKPARKHPRDCGAGVASVLSGSWRAAPAPFSGSAELLADVAPALLETGAGALAWRRISGTNLARSSPGRLLRQAYWNQALEAPQRELETWRTVYYMQSDSGAEPILVKGWTSARLYPEQGCRSYVDVDVCVAPERMDDAMRRLTDNARFLGAVDLHEGVADLDDRPWEEIYRRSRTAAIGPVQVRMLGPEDQLRHLCLHLMRHGAYRPLWLCDVAAALEGSPPDFDWTYFQSGDRRLTAWVHCTLGLARQLLGAQINAPAVVQCKCRAPDWMGEVVRRQWGLGVKSFQPTLAADYLRQATGLRRLLRDRWNDLNLVESFFTWGWPPPPDLPVWLVRMIGLPLHSLPFFVGRGGRPLKPKFSTSHPFDLHPRRAVS